jgi:O-methyltransferase
MGDLKENEFVTLLSPASLETLVGLALNVPPGDFAEVGVYQGGSALFLYEIAQEQGRFLHLFDTFEGMPTAGEFDTHKVGDFADVDFDRVRRSMPLAIFYKGLFPDTMPAELSPLAFVHIDCDQYQSVKDSIERLWPLVVEGGIMLFDDYSYLEGARLAVDEVFPRLFYTAQGKVFVVKGYENGFPG